ncbi:MAG TPA: DUF4382 domain-containing protein [Longimicrobiales bacterium]|nr:DUF4382 domain-containing protein [Longimicrobiales bacterium]
MRRHSFEGTVLVALTGLMAFALAACGGGDDDGPTEPLQTGTVRVALTDAPGNLVRAEIDIAQIVLRGTGGATVLRDQSQPERFDLVQLDGVTVPLGEVRGIPVGTYGQLGLFLRQALIETESGEIYSRSGAHPDPTGDLVCTICSLAPEGIPAYIGGEGLVLEDGETETIILDFDAFRSFSPESETGDWELDPAVSAAVEGLTGTVSGTVEIPQLNPVPGSCGGRSTIELFTPVLVDADNPDATWAGRTRPDGSYEIDLVPPGNYEISYVSTYELGDQVLTLQADPNRIGGLPVEVGQTTSLGFALSSGSCETVGAD